MGGICFLFNSSFFSYYYSSFSLSFPRLENTSKAFLLINTKSSGFKNIPRWANAIQNTVNRQNRTFWKMAFYESKKKKKSALEKSLNRGTIHYALQPAFFWLQTSNSDWFSSRWMCVCVSYALVKTSSWCEIDTINLNSFALVQNYERRKKVEDCIFPITDRSNSKYTIWQPLKQVQNLQSVSGIWDQHWKRCPVFLIFGSLLTTTLASSSKLFCSSKCISDLGSFSVYLYHFWTLLR